MCGEEHWPGSKEDWVAGRLWDPCKGHFSFLPAQHPHPASAAQRTRSPGFLSKLSHLSPLMPVIAYHRLLSPHKAWAYQPLFWRPETQSWEQEKVPEKGSRQLLLLKAGLSSFSITIPRPDWSVLSKPLMTFFFFLFFLFLFLFWTCCQNCFSAICNRKNWTHAPWINPFLNLSLFPFPQNKTG